MVLALLGLLHILLFRRSAPRYRAVKPASGLQRMIVKPEVRMYSMVNVHVRGFTVVTSVVSVVECIC